MFNYLLYRFAQVLALSLPLRTAYSIAVLLSDIRFLFARQDRIHVTGNLKVMFPQKSNAEIKKISKLLFRNFAKYLVDFFRFKKIREDYINKNIHIKDLHYLDDALALGKGAILLTAHMGNWELGGVVTAMLGYHFTTVALPHKSKRVNNFFNKQRKEKGLEVLPLGHAAKALLRALRKNGLLALVGDREFSGKGILVDLFGKPTTFPLGPAVLSLQTQAKIIPSFMLRRPDDTFDLIFTKPIEYNPSGDKDRDLREIVTKYKSVFEEYMRLYPEQWFIFKRFWY